MNDNIARKEILPDGHGGFAGEGWVHRKGATRAFPAGHPSLAGTQFAENSVLGDKGWTRLCKWN